MATVATELDALQVRLHDTNGLIWSRQELLDWYNDGLHDLLNDSGCVREFHHIDVPGRVSMAITYPWEDRHVGGGTTWTPFSQINDASMIGTYQWESEQMEGVTPTTTTNTITQQWERAYTGEESNQHFRFVLPRAHTRIVRVSYNDRAIHPIAVRELDVSDNRWMKHAGYQMFWTPGVGRTRTVEVYEIVTSDDQNYDHQNYGAGGIPRYCSGTRTYAVDTRTVTPSNGYAYTTPGERQALQDAPHPTLTGMGWRFTTPSTVQPSYHCTYAWEAEMLDGTTSGFTAATTVGTSPQWEAAFGATAVTFGLGTIRGMESTERQYLASSIGHSPLRGLGCVRVFSSSTNAIEVLQTVTPEGELTETDVPYLVPPQAQKYIRYFVLARAFGRQGEGDNALMSAHYEARFQRGVQVMKKLADVANKDHVYRRQEVGAVTPGIPRVRFPSTFESYW